MCKNNHRAPSRDLGAQTPEVTGAFQRLPGWTSACLSPAPLGFSGIFNPEITLGSSRPVVAVPEFSPCGSLAVATRRVPPAVRVPSLRGAAAASGGASPAAGKTSSSSHAKKLPRPQGKAGWTHRAGACARGSPASGGTRVIRPLRAGARVGTHGGLRRRGGERGRRAPRVPVPRTHRPRGVWDGSASSACRRVSVPCPVRAPGEAAANPDTWEEWGARTGLSLGCSCARPLHPPQPGAPHAAVSEPSAVFHAKLQLSPTGEVKFRSITCLC